MSLRFARGARIASVALLGLAGLYLLMRSAPLRPPDALIWVERGTALVGCWALAGAILSAADPPRAARLLGVSFRRLHYGLAWLGLALVTLHPLTVALVVSDWRVFVPQVATLQQAIQEGGRLAWYLLLIVATSLLGGRRAGGWRWLHLLVYPAFWLATAHALAIGRTHHLPGLRAATLIVAILTVLVPLWRRLRPGRVRAAARGR